MEYEPQTPESEPAQYPEQPDLVINLRENLDEPIGIAVLDQKYADNPEHLIQNSMLALILLLQSTDKVISLGPDYDGTLLGEKTQKFTDELLLSIAAGRTPGGYSMIAEELAEAAGSPSVELFCDHIKDFIAHKNHYLNNHNVMRYEQRIEPQARLRDSIYLITFAAERVLDRRLDTMDLSHEGGDIGSLDPELFAEYCGPFRFEGNIPTGTAKGLSGQVRRRLIFEAEHLNTMSLIDSELHA